MRERTSRPIAARVVPFVLAGAFAIPAFAVDIVIVKSGELPGHAEALGAFKKVTLSGDVLEIDVRAGGIEPGIQQKLKESPPKVLLAFGDPAVKAAIALKVAPVIHGLVADTSKLAGAAGVSSAVPEAVRLGALAGLSPTIKRIGVLHGASRKVDVEALAAAAGALGLTVTGSQIDGITSIPPTLRQLLATVDAMLVIPDEGLGTSEAMKFVFENSLEARKPSLSFQESHLSQGAVVVVAVDPVEVGTRLGELVNAVLKGESPAGLVPATKFKVCVNTRAAEHLGFSVDTSGATVEGNIATKVGTADAPPVIGVKVAAPIATIPDGPPSVVQTVSPDYPPMARKQKLAGEVLLDVTVGKEGNVVEAKVLRGSAMFNQAAQDAVMKYRFRPARKGGEAVQDNVQVTITFGM